MVMSLSNSFVFQAQELAQKLTQSSEERLTGYWLCEFLIPDRNPQVEPFYIGLLQGKVVFSKQKISWEALLNLLQRYIPRLRSDIAKRSIREIQQQWQAMLQEVQSASVLGLLDECYRLNLFSPQEMIEALRLKILADFDIYLFEYSGQAQFIPSFQLSEQVPIAGFDLQELLSEAKQRQIWWNRLQAQIPSMSCIPVLNQSAVQASNLTVEQKQRLEALTSKGKTLEKIAAAFAQDSLEIAKIFAKLISQELITLTSSAVPQTFPVAVPQNHALPGVVPETVVPRIFVVDDSPVLLRQFQNLVTQWGYVVKTSENPKVVVETMLQINPAIVFLDVNMPAISGFDLVKQIRRCPEFTSIPLIILTAEKTLTNNWRARWSGCRFLTKPSMSSEVPQFQMELRLLLDEMIPLSSRQLNHPVDQG
ncbi:response regulator [Phormidium tenue FACHB-886]|nr:response regulator [Phormidium tenue FACHB-886]